MHLLLSDQRAYISARIGRCQGGDGHYIIQQIAGTSHPKNL